MKKLLILAIFATGAVYGQSPDLSRQAEIIRTAHGVPHIRAKNLRAAGYALAWVQCEDYGTRTPLSILSASGRRASVEGREHLESDFFTMQHRLRTMRNDNALSRDVREVYEGFAAGVNRYIELHRADFPASMPADFTAQDVAATEIIPMPARKVRNFLNRLDSITAERRMRNAERGTRNLFLQSIEGALADRAIASVFFRTIETDSAGRVVANGIPHSAFRVPHSEAPRTINDEGSNAWAFGPSRTKSGRAILLRNPHLQWTAGYYEAQITVPGVVDFYGDFRIGSPFAVIGGFNKYLGWSTTNNSQDLDEFYVFDADPSKPDNYMLDGSSHALKRDVVNVSVRNGETLATETREFWSTPYGPVIHRANGKIYIVKFAGDGELRSGEQFLRMMRAKSLEKWKEAMSMRARPTSNFTYADNLGNIFFIWNASLPLLPHPVTEDTTATPVKKASEMWSKLVPFESLPKVLNPPGGYIHNENDSPHYTNIRGPLDTKNAYPNFEAPDLSLRSQLALQLIGGDERYSLEDVWRIKHSYRMLTADRVKGDLIAAVKATNPTGDVADAIALLERWDKTAAPESRGATLFEEWWATYSGLRRPERQSYPNNQRFAKVWSVADPFNTPRGLADPKRAAESFAIAVAETKRRYGAFDVTWGDVHRVRRGNVDVPVGGCGNDLGCFRVLGYARAEDDKLVATVGDGWVLAVEFDKTPRAISVLA
ncbi:MAG TPA: penicillin acylase family protein, partial [Pyrinomonadaceae bacterium]|nr:penicillin acylase family protein [Pyrinomonadaceae bacterium]